MRLDGPEPSIVFLVRLLDVIPQPGAEILVLAAQPHIFRTKHPDVLHRNLGHPKSAPVQFLLFRGQRVETKRRRCSSRRFPFRRRCLDGNLDVECRRRVVQCQRYRILDEDRLQDRSRLRRQSRRSRGHGRRSRNRWRRSRARRRWRCRWRHSRLSRKGRRRECLWSWMRWERGGLLKCGRGRRRLCRRGPRRGWRGGSFDWRAHAGNAHRRRFHLESGARSGLQRSGHESRQNFQRGGQRSRRGLRAQHRRQCIARATAPARRHQVVDGLVQLICGALNLIEIIAQRPRYCLLDAARFCRHTCPVRPFLRPKI